MNRLPVWINIPVYFFVNSPVKMERRASSTKLIRMLIIPCLISISPASKDSEYPDE